MRASLRKERNIWAFYSKDRSDWVPEELEDKIRWRAEIGYFPGCTASYVEPDVAQGTVQLLDAAGVEFTYMGDGGSVRLPRITVRFFMIVFLIKSWAL